MVVFLGLILLAYGTIFADKFFPQTKIGDSNLTFLTKPQAQQLLNLKFNQRSSQTLQFNSQPGSTSDRFQVDLSTASAQMDNAIIDQTFKKQHSGSILNQLFVQLQMWAVPNTYQPKIQILLDPQVQTIARVTDIEPVNASLAIDDNDQITTINGKAGFKLDQDALKAEVNHYLIYGTYNPNLPIKVTDPEVTNAKIEKAKQILESVKKQPIKLTYDKNSWDLDLLALSKILDFAKVDTDPINKSRFEDYLAYVIQNINQEVEEPQFKFDGIKVIEFRPAKKGQKLDEDKTLQLISQALMDPKQRNIALPVTVIEPKNQTVDVNNLGIKELLGEGVSHFAGSIDNRIYNVGLTAAKLNGVLLAPGEVFSFNKTVGDISAATGFKQAYVIKEGRTVLDDGGGVCQDSTTLFRAVLNAGLPVVKRTAHAYRVGYYEQGFPPGMDATVFYPSVDFQFKNDTPGYILIQAKVEGVTLIIDLYGTSDGRVATLTKPVVTNQTPPPPELRQDDPTLPVGTIKQVDWSAWGANVSFNRTVVKNGETIISETWRSAYKPWQAVFLVGTKPA